MNFGKKATPKHLFNDELPDLLYFDTTAIINALTNPITTEHKKIREVEATKKFVKRIIAEKKGIAICSLAIIEFWNIALLIEICKKYNYTAKKNPLRYARLKLKNKPALFTDDIKKKLDVHKKNFEIFMESFECFFIIESQYKIYSPTYKLMKKYHLESGDALHLATMFFGGEKNFVSFDRDFKRCYDIFLWKTYT